MVLSKIEIEREYEEAGREKSEVIKVSQKPQ